MRALLAILCLGCAAPATVSAACVRHAPAITLAERVQIVEPGATIDNAVTIRNADSCECPASCVQLTTGYHPPNGSPIPFAGLAGVSTDLVSDYGTDLAYVCLAPGEEETATLLLTVGAEQAGPGYVTPLVFGYRPGLPCFAFPDGALAWGPGCYEAEGACLGSGIDFATCRQFVYLPGPRS